MQSKWPGFLPGHFILLSLRPFITIQTTKQLNILLSYDKRRILGANAPEDD